MPSWRKGSRAGPASPTISEQRVSDSMDLDPACAALAAALAGTGPAVELAPDGTAVPVPSPALAPGTAPVVRTPASTGTPKAAMLGREALAASAAGTAARLGVEGQWL